jgi:hypothetical protein
MMTVLLQMFLYFPKDSTVAQESIINVSTTVGIARIGANRFAIPKMKERSITLNLAISKRRGCEVMRAVLPSSKFK